MSKQQRAILFFMGQIACLVMALWAAYQKQWIDAAKFFVMFGALRVDPNKHKENATIGLFFLFTFNACDPNFDIHIRGKSGETQAITGPTDAVTLNTFASTPVPSGTPGVWADNNGIPVMQASDNTQWKAGEATSIKTRDCSRISGVFGDLCANAALSEYYIYINGWKKLPQEDILLLHRAGAETITGRKTFPGGLSAPIIPSILSGTGVQVTGHIVPNIADDTFALLLANQELRNKTINATLNTIVGVPLSTIQMIAGAGLTGGGDLSANRTFNVVANADGSIVVNANDIQVGVITDSQHGNRGGGSLHANAVASGAAGFLTGTDKAKLDGVASGATNTPLSNNVPPDVNTGTAGVASACSRDDHTHDLPSIVTSGSCKNCSFSFDAKGRISVTPTNGYNGLIFSSGTGAITAGLQYLHGPDAALSGTAGSGIFTSPLNDVVIDTLSCEVDTAPGAGQTATFTIRKSSDHGGSYSDTNVLCTISDTGKTCNSTSLNDLVQQFDRVAIKAVGSAATAAANATCSFRAYK